MTVLRIKAFIYRLSNAFGYSIYLAQKEENEFKASLGLTPDQHLDSSIQIGMWQMHNGFTTVWTWGQPWYRAFWAKLKHAVGK